MGVVGVVPDLVDFAEGDLGGDVAGVSRFEMDEVDDQVPRFEGKEVISYFGAKFLWIKPQGDGNSVQESFQSLFLEGILKHFAQTVDGTRSDVGADAKVIHFFFVFFVFF